MSWIHKASFYQIFPDRFAKSPRVKKPSCLQDWDVLPTLSGFKGGDLLGIEEKLDHIIEMGFNSLYLCPIFSSTANHRYHTFNYHNVDPILGGNSAFERLLQTAHEKKMRVVIDGVFNHASRGFYQFNHTLENGLESPYLDWFHFNREKMAKGQPLDAYLVHPDHHRPGAQASHFDQVGYDSWWGIPALPKFNTAHPDVREFLLQIGEKWIQFGADGWRLDVPNEIDDDSFWQAFRQRVKAVKPDAYIVGEIWEEASRWLQGDQFDGVMNYPLTRAILGYFLAGNINREEIETSGLSNLKELSQDEFIASLQHLDQAYPAQARDAQLNLLGSHDTPRILTIACGDQSAVILSLVCLYLFPGIPCVYYGDEIGMSGGADPDCRRGYLWDSKVWNQDILKTIRLLNTLRSSHPSLHTGDFSTRGLANGVSVIRRSYGGRMVMGIFNTLPQEQKIELEESLHQGTRFEAWIFGPSSTHRSTDENSDAHAQTRMIQEITNASANNVLPVTLPARSALLLWN